MCRDVRVLEIESFMRCFLGIVGILGFYDFVIFSIIDVGIIDRTTLKPSRINTIQEEN